MVLLEEPRALGGKAATTALLSPTRCRIDLIHSHNCPTASGFALDQELVPRDGKWSKDPLVLKAKTSKGDREHFCFKR